jgi:amino acid permease
MMSVTDRYPKVGVFNSTVNIVKAFLCLGVLAAPYGFETVGYILAVIIIMIFGALNTYTVHLQHKIKRHYGNKVKNYTDMGKVCFGFWGHMGVVLTIIVN